MQQTFLQSPAETDPNILCDEAAGRITKNIILIPFISIPLILSIFRQFRIREYAFTKH